MMGLAGASVVFRVDASLQIGTGHVMRCLTLAAALRERGASCHFICRAHDGHLIDVIGRQKHAVTALPLAAAAVAGSSRHHRDWLGCDVPIDAALTIAALVGRRADWLVVDHYALDAAWESALRPHADRLLVIDDLADRPHDCDLLLDQNLGRSEAHYAGRVPAACDVLAGPRYALLRPEFAALREASLQRRARRAMRHVLLSMGGVDAGDATCTVLRALGNLQGFALPADVRLTVVMGPSAPWLARVREQAAGMPWPTEVLVGISDMARRMADSDLAIAAAGSTVWELCCLGLPSVIVVLADNQREAARNLKEAGASECIALGEEFERQLGMFLEGATQRDGVLSRMARAALEITDGTGCDKVASEMSRLTLNDAWEI